MVSVEKHIYSVQSVLGPRDMFPAYTVQNLKSTASRLLIQSVGDYPVSSKENCESNATAEKISHKRLRPQENNIMNKTDKDKKIKHNIEDVPLKDSHSQVIQSPGNQKQGMSKQNFEDFQHFNSTTPPTNTSNYAANVRHKLITQSPGDIDEKHFLTSPFERWNIKFEGFPQKQNVVSDTSSAGTGNEHQRFDCGICGSYVSEEKFRCTTCSLVVHKSCLQHTTLKDQLANSKNSTHWSCPVCSLIEFCSKHPVNGVDSLDRDYFTCIFCPTKEPLIMMERMKSGLFTHSLCKFIINVEEESMQRCSICGLEGTGLVSLVNMRLLFTTLNSRVNAERKTVPLFSMPLVDGKTVMLCADQSRRTKNFASCKRPLNN